MMWLDRDYEKRIRHRYYGSTEEDALNHVRECMEGYPEGRKLELKDESMFTGRAKESEGISNRYEECISTQR